MRVTVILRRLTHRIGQQLGRGGQLGFAGQGEAQQQSRRERRLAGAVPVQFVQADSGAAGPQRDGPLVRAVRELGQQVQARRGAVDADLGQVGAQRPDQDVPLGPVPAAHRPQVPLQRRVPDERGQGQLIEGRRGDPGDHQDALHLIDQAGRRHHPGQPQRRGQRLAGRSQEHHPVRGQPLQRGHRLPAEPVLHVVVVLDDQRLPLVSPGQQGGSALRGHQYPGRVLVRRRDHHRVDVGRGQLRDHQAVRVHPHRDRFQARVLGGVALPAPARILDRHPAQAAAPQHLADHGQGLRRRAADDHLLRLDDDPAHPGQIASHGVPQLVAAPVPGVPQPPVGQVAQRLHQRRLPPGPREGMVVGLARTQVVAEPLRRGPRSPRRGGGGVGQVGHHGARAAPGGQVALGGQLGVAAHHHAAGHPELLSQGAAGREHRARPQPAGPDRDPQRVLQLPAQRDPRLERDIELHSWQTTWPPTWPRRNWTPKWSSDWTTPQDHRPTRLTRIEYFLRHSRDRGTRQRIRQGAYMGRIRVHEFVTLDGVIDAPSWTADFGFDPGMGEVIGAVTGASDGILLGRTTYQMFEPAWSQRTVDDDPGAPFFNDTTKYVVSSTLTKTTWRNSQIIGGYDAKEIQRLKEDDSSTGLYVSGSATLVRALLADGLVDELHLFVYPVVRGAGPRLFGAGVPASTWQRADAALYDNGATYLKLTPAT